MKPRSLVILFTGSLVACAANEPAPNPYDGDYGVGPDTVNEGAPPNNSLPDDNKADAVYPTTFQVGDQSPVRNQASRGVCSIFASTALVENLYIKAGMPVEQANFSEQYLQWAAKNLGHGFPNTEGSSSDVNLRTVVNFGTVLESEWAYETFPWNSANDAECTGGENLPTKCYTNGEPPANVGQAKKFKLPSSRFVNTNSIKATIFTKKTGVNVGFTFFYQSWNHRRSTLPISDELWRRGIVTYPNAKDKEESLKHRAGHAVQLVGWDDDLEVEMRDGDGNPVLDANGQPKKEKGFWIFKNSWGTASFGVQHSTGPGYGYLSYKYISDYGSAVTGEVPRFENPKEVCDDAGNADEDGNGKANCDDAACAMHPSCMSGGTAHSYSSNSTVDIPDNDLNGASSKIDVADAGMLTDVKVTVDITHTFRGDLTLTLTHGGTTQTLVTHEGGSADDLKRTFTVPGFTGGALAGDWTLSIVDDAAQDVGRLNSWTLDVATH